MQDLLRFNFNQNYIIIDTETEGLNLISSRPWQISWITAKGKKIISKNNRFLKWVDLSMSTGAARVTNFDFALYEKRAEDPKLVLNDLWKIISDPSYIVVGQNFLGYDIYILNVLRKILGYKTDYSYVSRILDTRSIAMAIGLGYSDLKVGDILTQYRLLNNRDKKIKASQSALLKQYEIEHDSSKLHDALYDIEMTFQIFWKQIQHITI